MTIDVLATLLARCLLVFAGTSRDDSPFPVQYLGANVPQAWAAGSVFMLLQSILGLSADVSAGTLFIDADLPDWLPRLALDGMRIGSRSLDLEVWREGERTLSSVSGGDGIRLVQRPLGTGPKV